MRRNRSARNRVAQEQYLDVNPRTAVSSSSLRLELTVGERALRDYWGEGWGKKKGLTKDIRKPLISLASPRGFEPLLTA